MNKIIITTILLFLLTNISFGQNDDIKLAIKKFKAGDSKGSITLLDSLIEINAKDTSAYKYKYQICFYSNQEEEGFEAIKKIFPFPEACVNFGNLYYSKRKYSDASRYYNKALEDDPKYVDAIFNRGLCKRYQYNTSGAIKDFELALEIKPKYMQVYNSLGNAYSSQFDYDKAIETYDKAIKIDPNYKEAYYNKGLVYYKRGKYYEAKKEYDKAINLDANFKEALYNRGIAKLKLDDQIMNNSLGQNIKIGEVEGACDDLRKAYKLGYVKAKSAMSPRCPEVK